MFTNQGIFDYIKGQRPDMFVEHNETNVLSTVGATCKYACQGYIPLFLFLTILYKYYDAKYLVYYNKGQSPDMFVEHNKKNVFKHRRCDT